VQDEFAEGVLRILVREGPRTLAQPRDYAARANLVWAATWALNGAIGAGVPQDWATHMIGHELTALHGLDHARTLAVVLPSLLEVRRDAKREKLLQYGERVWGIREGSVAERVDAAIARTRAFYESIGLPTTLSAHGIRVATAPEVARRLAARGMTQLGERGEVTPAVVEEILRRAA
jgi:NADP-dependent alcohol dehydrogenase